MPSAHIQLYDYTNKYLWHEFEVILNCSLYIIPTSIHSLTIENHYS